MAFFDARGVLQQGSISDSIAANQRQWRADTARRQSQAKGRKWRNLAIGGAALAAGAAAAPTLAGMFTGGGGVVGGGGIAAGGGGSVASGIGTTAGYGSLFPGTGQFLAPAAPSRLTPASRWPAATAGLGARLGSMFNSAGMNLGVNAGLSLLQMRSQNKAADQARQDTLAANREAIALQRQQLELQQRNADLDREERQALNAAINELKKRELDAAEEERAFTRSIVEQREARLEPFRRRGAQALDRLASMWSLG